MKEVAKSMSNLIQLDLRPYVSPMTTEVIKSMSPSKKMTRNLINSKTTTIKPKEVITGSASINLATRSLRMSDDMFIVTTLYINPSCNIGTLGIYDVNSLVIYGFCYDVYVFCLIIPIFGSFSNLDNFTLGCTGKVSHQFINYMSRIVYTTCFILICSVLVNLSQNTSIKNQKSAHSKES